MTKERDEREVTHAVEPAGGPSRPARWSQRVASPGTAPGLLVVDPNAPPSVVQAFLFDPDELIELGPEALVDLGAIEARGQTCWLDVQGLGDADVLRRVAERFDVHPLALEDIVNVGQSPKLDDYGQQLFIVTRMLRPGSRSSEQLCILLGPGFVVTFQEEHGDAFGPVRDRLRHGGARIRQKGPAYLVYALLDTVTDQYFPVIEECVDQLDEIEEVVLEHPEPDIVPQLYGLRRELMAIRRDVWPLRELLGRMTRGDVTGIGEDVRLYMRDCHDHAQQILTAVDDARDQASSLADAVLALSGQRMNDIMRVLTVMASVFVPLTFIAGVYGMNFDDAASDWSMPELEWAYGYPAVLLLMAGIAGGLLLVFRRKGWLRMSSPSERIRRRGG